MQPIYNKLIKMWSDLGYLLPISEGTYWLDNGIIKAFNKETGELCNLYKYTVDYDLNILIKKHKDYNKSIKCDFETWEETTKRYKTRLSELEQESITLLKEYGLNTDRTIVDTNSTGKDSMVKTYLAHKAGLQFTTYFNVTTLDVGESNRMAKENDYTNIYPSDKYKAFYPWVKTTDTFPSRLNRCCCNYFKETPTVAYFSKYKNILFLFGMRNDESTARSGYTDVWINTKWGKQRDWIGILPIRKWTDLDIWLYIFRENISINEKYKMGYSRVGCAVACPNYSKTTWVLDKYWYPKMYNRWRNMLKEDFIKNNKWLIMNCTLKEYCHQAWNGGVFRKEPTEEVIEEYATYNDLDIEIARKYFNRYCVNGCLNHRKEPKKIKNKDVLGMNMKFFGRNIEKFKCKKCLMKEMNWTDIEWNKQVEDFKLQGCKLF